MSPKPERSSWWQVSALTASLVVSPCTSWASPGRGLTPLGVSSNHADKSIRRALSLLQAPTPVPIEVIDARKLPRALGQVVKRTCAYVQKGILRIYVNSSCPVYQAAGDSLFDAMKLAAILRHEMAHLDGEDEARAYFREVGTFRELLGRAPAHFLTRGMAYAVELERRAAALIADTEGPARPAASAPRTSEQQHPPSIATLPVPRH
jgi:hypothetical protein